MRSWLRTIVGVLCVAALLAAPAVASAHLKFESFEPGDRPLATAPDAAVLTFTAEIGTGLTEASLVGPDGTTTRLVPVISGKQARLPLPEKMAAGTWTVEWAATGADGHPQRDSRAFSIERASTPSASAVSFPAARWRAVSFIGRVSFFGALLLFVGAGVFAAVAARGFVPARWGAMATGVIVGAVLVLAAHNAVSDRRSLLGLLDPRGWFDAITEPGGRGYAIAAVAVVAALKVGRRDLVPEEWRRRAGAPPWILLAFLAVALVGPTLSSHAMSSDLAALRIPFDVLHVAAAAMWLGGLVQLLALTIPRRASNPGIPSAIDRYSRLAFWSIVTVVGTGLLAALIELDASVADLFGDTYGRLVLLKLLLLGITMPLARINQQRHIPAIHRDGPSALPALRRYVRWEVAIAIWIVIATAALVHAAPPGGADAAHHPTNHASHD